ncbi:hypothetical protein [Nonomuraea dietziae]|uniref:hypothetical protein n=1 Tax=Nonomuraea dietziae TaxID=65515 RepID=UPI003415D1F8
MTPVGVTPVAVPERLDPALLKLASIVLAPIIGPVLGGTTPNLCANGAGPAGWRQ